MTCTFLDVVQGSPEWAAARLGIPTASEFDVIMAPGRTKAVRSARRTYLYKLAGEILTGYPADTGRNGHMDRGNVMESDARAHYEMVSGEDVVQVGFARNAIAGASPDGLVGSRGLVEFKTKLPHLLIGLIMDDEFPEEHRAQCQGNLWVTEREWVDICVYWPGIPVFIKREHRDEEYISRMAEATAEFVAELAEIVAIVRGDLPRRAAA